MQKGSKGYLHTVWFQFHQIQEDIKLQWWIQDCQWLRLEIWIIKIAAWRSHCCVIYGAVLYLDSDDGYISQNSQNCTLRVNFIVCNF